jgi:CelD/BcsL family acetyltransferase involved in cellulose biosynthesis
MTPQWRLLPASQFAGIAPQWDALNEAACRSPLLTAAFVQFLLEHFGSGAERLALYGTAEQLDIACVLVSGTLSSASFQPSQAPIGLYLQRQAAALDLPALKLLMPKLGMSTLLGLMQLDPDLLPRPIADRADPDVDTDADPGAGSESLDYIQTARITLSGSFEDYWAARGKNLRANMKKQRNKLEAEGITLRLEVVTEAADVAAGIADYGRLEAASWKAAGGTAITADNVQGRFYRAVLEHYCALGAGRIYRYYFDDKVVAMDLCVAHAGTMVILKTSFDETIKGSSPALLMRHEYLPGIYARKEFERIEFYGRVMDWHTKWSDEIRTLYHVTVFRWPLAQSLYRWRQQRRAKHSARELAQAAAAASASASAATPAAEPAAAATTTAATAAAASE